jgi:hypothetical protein
MSLYYFYKIVCLDPTVSDFYIGSTKNLTKRMNLHKINCKTSPCKVYKMIRANGGWLNWTVTIIKKKKFNEKMKALEYEYKLMEQLGSTLNTQRCFNSNGRCIHKKIKSQCLSCKGTRVCIHNRIKNQCKDCKGSMVCNHNKFIAYCKNCSPYHCDTCDLDTSKGNKISHIKSKKHYNNIMQRLVEIKQRVEEIKETKYLKMIHKITNQKGDIIHLNKLSDNQLSEIEQLLNNIEIKNRKRNEINFYD